MKTYFSWGALTLGVLGLAASPAGAEAHFHFGINLSFQCDGLHWPCRPCHHGQGHDWCGPWRLRTAYIVVFPGCDGGWAAPDPWSAPDPHLDGGSASDEAAAWLWSAPSPSAGPFRSVSFAPYHSPALPSASPTQFYYPPLAAPGMTFDR